MTSEVVKLQDSEGVKHITYRMIQIDYDIVAFERVNSA